MFQRFLTSRRLPRAGTSRQTGRVPRFERLEPRHAFSAPGAGMAIDFDDFTVGSYAGAEDRAGVATIEDAGATLHLRGNTWKKIDYRYTITPYTVLEFDFKTAGRGDLHAIGFDNNTAKSFDKILNLAGFESWGIRQFRASATDGAYRNYRIPIGQFYTGAVQHLFFINDHDVLAPRAESFFTNLRIYEAPSTVIVGTRSELLAAVNSAGPGTQILLRPGTYAGGIFINDLHGTPAAPITIGALDPANKPVIDGTNNSESLHFSDVSHLVIRDLVVQNSSINGINIDDGGSYATPSHHVTLSGLHVRDIGTTGNHDGIKLSGLDHFLIRDTLIERWGNGGSGIDMVGCHEGLIERTTLRHGDGMGSTGIQAKGGSRDVVVRDNRFENAGLRAMQIGGSTGLQFFRPAPQGYEAKDITVEGNVFIGSQAAVTFVNVDGALVRYNTIYRPTRWIFRILQETTQPGFVPSRNGVVHHNIIVFRTDEIAAAVNVGPNTAPETFQFSRNWWYAVNNPSASRLTLPVPETDGIYRINPQFIDVDAGDLRLRPRSPARRYGAYVLRG